MSKCSFSGAAHNSEVVKTVVIVVLRDGVEEADESKENCIKGLPDYMGNVAGQIKTLEEQQPIQYNFIHPQGQL